jgi:hypothetical protein
VIGLPIVGLLFVATSSPTPFIILLLNSSCHSLAVVVVVVVSHKLAIGVLLLGTTPALASSWILANNMRTASCIAAALLVVLVGTVLCDESNHRVCC